MSRIGSISPTRCGPDLLYNSLRLPQIEPMEFEPQSPRNLEMLISCIFIF